MPQIVVWRTLELLFFPPPKTALCVIVITESSPEFQETEADFQEACPNPEYVSGAQTSGATFPDYSTSGADPWVHVDYQTALLSPSGPKAFPDFVTGSAAPVQTFKLSLHVSNFAGLNSGATYDVMIDSTPPVCRGPPTATVSADYRTIVMDWDGLFGDDDSGMTRA